MPRNESGNKKMLYTFIMECYATVRNNAVIKFAYTLIYRSCVLIRDMGQRDRDWQNDHTNLWDIKIRQYGINI